MGNLFSTSKTYKVRGTDRMITKDEILRIMSFDIDEKEDQYFQYRGYTGLISYRFVFQVEIDGKTKNVGSFLCGYANFGNHNYLWDEEIEDLISEEIDIEFTATRGFDHAHYNDVMFESKFNTDGTIYYDIVEGSFKDISLATPEFVKNEIKNIIDMFIELIETRNAIIIQKHFRSMLGRRHAIHLKYKPGGPGYEAIKKNWYKNREL